MFKGTSEYNGEILGYTYEITFNKSLEHTGRFTGIEDGLNAYCKKERRTENLNKMAKKTKAELAEIWARNNNICGEQPWWDKSKMYYNLTVEQIIKMAKYIETKSKVIGG